MTPQTVSERLDKSVDEDDLSFHGKKYGYNSMLVIARQSSTRIRARTTPCERGIRIADDAVREPRGLTRVACDGGAGVDRVGARAGE